MKYLVALLFAFQASLLSAQQWSKFQNGANPEGYSAELATEWSPETGIAWEKELAGYGQSSPVVFDDVVYVTSVTGPNKEKVNIEAFAVSEGNRKWIYSADNSTPQENTVMISRAAPTPACDEQGVIAMFGGGNLLALNPEGELRWQRDFAAEFGDVKARHGLSASIEQNANHVFVWVERTEQPYIVAVNKTNGETVWKVDGVGSTSWGSPRLISVAGEQHLVLSAIGKIVGLDPASGDRLWEFENVAGNSSVTPIPIEDGMFLIGSTGSREGVLEKPCTGVLHIEKQDDAFSASWVWSSSTLTCSFGSPLVFEGQGYFVNRTGVLSCHNLNDGELVFKGRIPSGQTWATPLVANRLLYFFGKSGSTAIIKAGTKLEVVNENQLWTVEGDADKTAGGEAPRPRFSSKVLYAGCIAGNQLLLRRGDKIFAVKPTSTECCPSVN